MSLEILKEQMKPHVAEMKTAALAAPIHNEEENQKAAKTYSHGTLFKIANQAFLSVILTVSLMDEDDPFWHVSMAFLSPAMKPKSILLWTKDEKRSIRELLRFWLEDCGVKEDEKFLRTETALHLSKSLTQEELQSLAKADAL